MCSCGTNKQEMAEYQGVICGPGLLKDMGPMENWYIHTFFTEIISSNELKSFLVPHLLFTDL